MGQPRLITAQFNRIQCGRRGWLQGPAFFFFSLCHTNTEKDVRKECVCVCVCLCRKKCLDGGEKYKKMKGRFQSIS